MLQLSVSTNPKSPTQITAPRIAQLHAFRYRALQPVAGVTDLEAVGLWWAQRTTQKRRPVSSLA